jgi:hypothetical protein
LAINMRPLAAGAITQYHYVYNDRVSKTIQIFPNRAKPAQAAAKSFQEKRLAFLRFPFSSRNRAFSSGYRDPPGEKTFLRSFLRHSPSPWPASFGEQIKAITFSDFRKQNLGDFAVLGDLPCQERVQNADGSLTPFKPFPPIGHGLSLPARRQTGRPHRATE